MKHLLGIFIVVLLLVVTSQQVSAQITGSPRGDDGTFLSQASPPPVQSVDYEMPYPGLLPDNPFYILKTTRDQIVGLLITDSFKKAEFDLLQSDKRFQAGVMLYQKDRSKKKLSFTTISKGHNYLDKAIEKTGDAGKQKVVISGIRDKIYKSIQKQREVLTLLRKSREDEATEIDTLLQRLDVLQEKATQIIPVDKPK